MKPILEPIYLGQEKTITAFYYDEPNFNAPWHFHPQHELTYIENSYGTKFIGDHVGAYEPGELILVRSNLPHCWKNQIEENNNAKSLVIQWNQKIFTQVPELDSVFEMLNEASRGILFDRTQTKQFIKALKKLIQSKDHDLYIGLLKLLVDLSKCNYTTLSEASFIDNIPTEHNNRMTSVHEFIETNFNRKVYLKEVSDLVKMSEQSFSRFFHKMMGRSFFTFLNEYRINMASRMLLTTDKTVSQIAFDCGYDSPPFFFKKFNEMYHVSPSRYRQQHLK